VWHAVVQVRQRVSHKRTFFFLEQLLLKHGAHSDTINIVTYKDGMDFYFKERQPAVRFLDFLSHHVPTKSKYARKLVSADHKGNVGDFKHNYFVEIIPVCKDDLAVLPLLLARSLSDVNPLCLIKAVGAEVHVQDPRTGERHEVSVDKYWRHEFTPVMTSRELLPFVVLSVEPIMQDARASAKKRGAGRKVQMAECVVARESDFGVNDTQFTMDGGTIAGITVGVVAGVVRRLHYGGAGGAGNARGVEQAVALEDAAGDLGRRRPRARGRGRLVEAVLADSFVRGKGWKTGGREERW
jgi:nonsense-mediated mRNA decay protein 3